MPIGTISGNDPAPQGVQFISMKDMYRLASMHQRAHKHGHLKPLSKSRFVVIGGPRAEIAWNNAERSRFDKTREFNGWGNYFTHTEWLRKHHPEWPF